MNDSYIRESCKSYQKCHVANSARRNSLMKKTIGIEVERKLASHQMDREERHLREHLKQMKIEKAKTASVHGLRDSEMKNRKAQLPQQQESPDCDFVDPYPVTFASLGSTSPIHRQRSNTMERDRDIKAGLRYAAGRDRRVSKEFEDLCLNTTTGKLAIPTHILLHPVMSLSTAVAAPFASPHRKISGSRTSLESVDSHWPGDPEAIHSVRRARKSVGQQDKERISRMMFDLNIE